MSNKRISIFTGHFGSGKTEVAVNFTLKLSEHYEKTAIVDFDIVNPFFRTMDAKSKLEKKNIWVIAPLYANTNVDVPALPPEINTLFEKKEYKVVFDVGGDDLGAKVLSRYRDEILQDDYELFVVVNTRRPMTDTGEKIEEMIYSIEASSRIKVTSIVNNTHLLQNTSIKDIIDGQEIIQSVSNKLNIPIRFTGVFYNNCENIKKVIDNEVFCMEKLIRLPWE